MDSLGRDRAPLALARFDAKRFADEIRHRFGDGDEAPFVIDVCDFTGQRANWLILSSGWGVARESIDELLQMCAARGLHIFSAGWWWNNPALHWAAGQNGGCDPVEKGSRNLSFQVFMQCFTAGRLSGVSAAAVRGAFSNFAEDSEPDYWHLRYDDANSCHVHVTQRDDLIQALTVDRPCGDRRLWDSIYRVLQLGSWVLYFPASKPPLVVADAAHAEQLPPGMREALGPVRQVRSGKEIQEIIRSS
jgi:hypothetical protein